MQDLKKIACDSQNHKKEKFKDLGSNINQLSKMFEKEIDKSKGQSVKYAKYKYGTIVMVNFNINVGDELCGNHFAIVLTNEDSPYSSMLTVLPLSSKNKSNRISLGELISSTIYNEIIKKIKKLDSDIIDQPQNISQEELKNNVNKMLKVIEMYSSKNRLTYALID